MIRLVNEDDAPRLLEIYSHYVKNTAITFEYDVPSVEEFRGRIRATLENYPYFAAVHDGKIIGYAYAGRFHPRKAYDYAAETTIYLDKDARGKGAGKELYGALELALGMLNIVNLVACIGFPEVEDKYLTRNSVDFHAHMDYRFVGQFHKCGYKFGTWYDMVYMEKCLSVHPEKPSPIVPFAHVAENFWKEYNTAPRG